MSELLKSGKVGLTVFKNLAEQRQAIVESWSASGLVKGLEGVKKSNVAQLLENQAQAMLNEVTLDSSAGRFDTVAFPIVRRVFSRLLANEIVSVQPLALPSGLLFYMDARVSLNGNDTQYGATPPGIQNATGTESKVAPQNTANGQTGPTFASTTAYERFYNNQGFDLSFGTGETALGTAETITADNFTNGLFNDSFTLTGFDVSKQQSSASLAFSSTTDIYYSAGSTNTLVVAAGGDIPYFHQVQTWALDQFNGNVADVVLDLRPAGVYGSDFDASMLNDGAGATGAGFTLTVTPHWQAYNDLEAKSEMAELTIRFSSVTVNTVTRKLRAHWTPELAQDLEAYHSIDAEAELTALLSEHVAAEIDREIIIDLINGAPFKARWDYNGLANNANFFGTQKDWNQT